MKSQFGLVLAGGGAKGAFQVGVLRFLAEEGLEPQIIAGTSIGALNGAVVACGGSFAEGVKKLESVWRDLGSIRVIKWNPDPSSVLDAEPLERLIRDYVNPSMLREGTELWVTAFPVAGIPGMPFGSLDALATLLKVGGDVSARWFRVQDCADDEVLYTTLLASAALPFLFPQRKIDGGLYVDGGVAENVPIRGLKERGCDHVVVVHLSTSDLWNRHDYPDYTIIEVRPQLSVDIERSSARFGWVKALLDFDPTRIDQLIDCGYRAAQATIPTLARKLHQFKQIRTNTLALLRSTMDLEDEPL
jgi:NTE family protein